MSSHSEHHENHDHGSLKSYVVGFILSIIATCIPFAVIYYDLVQNNTAVLLIFGFAVLQFIIQIVFFMHLSFAESKGKRSWDAASLLFSVVVLLIIVGGSAWIMISLDHFAHVIPH